MSLKLAKNSMTTVFGKVNYETMLDFSGVNHFCITLHGLI